jgi:arsenite methyltransferase
MPAAVQVFDPPMCCASGACGPTADPALARFAADLDWLKAQGGRVERYNLSQQPAAFAARPEVTEALAQAGTSCLPLILVEGRVVSRGRYPTRAELAAWADAAAPASARTLPLSQGCCGGGSSSCC